MSKLIDMLYEGNIPLHEAAKRLNLTAEQVKKLLHEEYKSKFEASKKEFKKQIMNLSMN